MILRIVDNRARIAVLLADLDERAPGGFAIGLHIDLTGPTFLFQTFPQEWVDYYANQGLQLRDPAMHWAFANSGSIRWHQLKENDPTDVIGKAAAHGMPYGATISMLRNDSRTVAGFARADRDYLDVELDEITDLLARLHDATLKVTQLSQADLAALKKMSIRLSHS